MGVSRTGRKTAGSRRSELFYFGIHLSHTIFNYRLFCPGFGLIWFIIVSLVIQLSIGRTQVIYGIVYIKDNIRI